MDEAIRVASSADSIHHVYNRLQEYGTVRRPNFDSVERPTFEKRTEKARLSVWTLRMSGDEEGDG